MNKEEEYKVEEIRNYIKQEYITQFLVIRRDTATSITNGSLKQDYHMQKRQLKTIRQEF